MPSSLRSTIPIAMLGSVIFCMAVEGTVCVGVMTAMAGNEPRPLSLRAREFLFGWLKKQKRPVPGNPADHDAFLRTIAAEADEDTPRLVYADYLSEQGLEDRAELIRVQVAMVHAPDREVQNELRRRADELIAQHPEWIPEAVSSGEHRAVFRRGFIEEIGLKPCSRPGDMRRIHTMLNDVAKTMPTVKEVIVPTNGRRAEFTQEHTIDLLAEEDGPLKHFSRLSLGLYTQDPFVLFERFPKLDTLTFASPRAFTGRGPVTRVDRVTRGSASLRFTLGEQLPIEGQSPTYGPPVENTVVTEVDATHSLEGLYYPPPQPAVQQRVLATLPNLKRLAIFFRDGNSGRVSDVLQFIRGRADLRFVQRLELGPTAVLANPHFAQIQFPFLNSWTILPSTYESTPALTPSIARILVAHPNFRTVRELILPASTPEEARAIVAQAKKNFNPDLVIEYR